jgi:diguanylate cyclase (GGDEF)-like protein
LTVGWAKIFLFCATSYRIASDCTTVTLEIRILNILSVIYGEAKNLQSALQIGQKVLEYCRELKSANGESLALNNQALTYLDLGDGEKALETALEALRVAHENKVTDLESSIMGTVGEIYAANDDFANAEEYLTRDLTLAREQNNHPDQIQCLTSLGKIYQRQQNHEAARNAFHNALSISEMINDRPGELNCHKLLSDLYEKSGECEKALQHFRKFHVIQENIFNEKSAKHLAGLQVIHQVETVKRDAQIHYLRTIELKREIEERKNAQAALEKLASVDPLTEALNRREFFILGERELKHALQTEQPLTVILFDIDHLKQINDTYGHAIGDRVLIHTTKIVRESLRQGEIIGRFGGDEFVIMLPGSNCTQGQQIAGRLNKKTASQAIATGKNDLYVTISLGIAELNQANDSTLETLLDCADQALYVAKQSGRNQLAVYSNSFS